MTTSAIRNVRAERRRLGAEMSSILAAAEKRGPNATLLASEQRRFDEIKAEARTFDERIDELEDAEDRRQQAREGAEALGLPNPETRGGETVTGGAAAFRGVPSRVYYRDGQHGWVADLVRRQLSSDSGAAERLATYGGEVRMALERRDISRVDTAGGEFVPPLWLLADYAEMSRAGRVTADRFRSQPLPPGTDSINIPRITTGSAVAAQSADNAAVAETDMVTAGLACPVRTYAGQQDVALQLLEQSPIAFDQIVFADLLADYNSKVDAALVNGPGTAGTLLGVTAVSGIGAVTYTDGTPTLPELYPKLADAITAVLNARKLPPECFIMAPRRWTWILSQMDSTGRPYVIPSAGGPQNAPGVSGALTMTAPVGNVLGLPVFIDPNIPTTLGAGAEDVIICGRFSDAILWEGNPRMRVLPEVLSGNLTVRCQLYNYVAAAAGRFPGSFCTVGGTGLIL